MPQGGQPHTLAARVAGIADQRFPGFLDELVGEGAKVWNDGDLSRLRLAFGERQPLRSGKVPEPQSIVFTTRTGPFPNGTCAAACAPFAT
ncbi:hypothetical protein [Mycobacterium palustre]|uniref:Uncharacterized protein n=1 Tax=Mycobacterium palustre TaxID=153971 RepID=A0A1X1ZQU3_9MYCO|nr:hypothetical protein [Mycobacterium palustre]MCV7099059.1 hypothetical protein [Mycobacterium palustre]ORW25756.1 hypothetical protein AWC19_06150 [Mycobacterium palustre]